MDTKIFHDKIKEIVPVRFLTFLDPKDGVSSSEANHIANKIKEKNQISMALINQADAANEHIIFKNNTDPELFSSPSKADFTVVKSVGTMYGFSAWLREGIKAKSDALNFLNKIDHSDLIKEPTYDEVPFVDSMPKYNVPKFTEEDAAGFLGVGEYSEYLYLNSYCAEIGKLIHDDGKLNKIKNDLNNFKRIRFHKLAVAGGWEDTLVTRTPAYDTDEINKIFMDLLNDHREAEKKLNWFRAKIENLVNDKNASLEEQYRKDYNRLAVVRNLHLADAQKIIDENERKRTEWISESSEFRYNLRSIFSSYKIVIPQRFQESYASLKEFVN